MKVLSYITGGCVKKPKTENFEVYDAIHTILKHIGEDPEREGLKDTARRMISSWSELLNGYSKNPADIFKLFSHEGYSEMILLKNIEFNSMCEHHFLIFSGTVHIAYLPDTKIIGISKLARLVDIFSHRLQVQERLTLQIIDTLMEHLKPRGAGVVIEAAHSCMGCRGVKRQGSTMVTSALRGSFLKPEVRQEFLKLVVE